MVMAGLLQRLQQQNFGPNDSVIASGLMHPQDGLLKMGKWFQDNVNTAAGIPNISNQDEASMYAYGPSDEQKVEAANNLSGLLQTSAFASGAAPASAGGTLGTFIGPKSMGWNQEAANTATKLLDSGADPAQVWKDHLIGRMPDGNLFSEIDDSTAKFLPKETLNNLAKNDPYGVYNAPLNEYITHQELFNKYPELNKTSSYYDSESPDYAGASFNLSDNEIILGAGLDNNELKSGSLHELQHAIQEKEKWARGGPHDEFKTHKFQPFNYQQLKDAAILDKMSHHHDNILDTFNYFEKRTGRKPVPGAEAALERVGRGNVLDNARDQVKLTLDPYDSYLRLTGEAQARATQDRMNMNMQQRRDIYPLAGGLLSDIPLDHLINRYR